ncbi:cupin domain-containing protein [Inquilinus sp.]|jgi:uncharacterized cupin superfamily protein|uniref:cupin domain-containing protein n=1 Tax=Inquilinus sp. TaxID=1932117 RepID=UPI0037842D29
MPTDAPKPISSNDVAWEEWSDIPRFTTRYRHLTRAAVGGDYHVGVAIEELGPGKQSSPAHYHLFEEEHVFILEGTVTARLGADTFEMKAGDYICYPAGQKAGHCLLNTGNAVCRYVVVGERNPNEICVYTDTNKVLVRPLGRRKILDLAATRNYWDGEDTGLPPGVAPPPDAVAPEAAVEPKPPISEAAVDWHEDGVAGSARFGGRSKHLTHAAVGPGYRVGVLIESPAPGKRLCPTHYHMLEEEHALVLEGQVTLILGDERHELTAGDYVCFPAGRKVGHSFVNSGPGPCRTLMIGEHNPNEVCVYPDSNKMAVGALCTRDDIFDMAGTRRYWDGEETG